MHTLWSLWVYNFASQASLLLIILYDFFFSMRAACLISIINALVHLQLLSSFSPSPNCLNLFFCVFNPWNVFFFRLGAMFFLYDEEKNHNYHMDRVETDKKGRPQRYFLCRNVILFLHHIIQYIEFQSNTTFFVFDVVGFIFCCAFDILMLIFCFCYFFFVLLKFMDQPIMPGICIFRMS